MACALLATGFGHLLVIEAGGRNGGDSDGILLLALRTAAQGCQLLLDFMRDTQIRAEQRSWNTTTN